MYCGAIIKVERETRRFIQHLVIRSWARKNPQPRTRDGASLLRYKRLSLLLGPSQASVGTLGGKSSGLRFMYLYLLFPLPYTLTECLRRSQLFQDHGLPLPHREGMSEVSHGTRYTLPLAES